MFSNQKKFTVIFFLAAGVILSIAAGKPSLVQPNNDFKNLQVLPKDISEDSLDKIMDNFKAALNVRCNICHVRDDAKDQWDFASDEKPEKDITRHMMRMTADINAKYFNFENSARTDTITVVRCETCHRGDPHPDEFKMPKEEHHDTPPPPTQQGEKKGGW